MDKEKNRNIIHNDTNYIVNINRLRELSDVASKIIDSGDTDPIKFSDSLDEQSFSTFVQYINEINFRINSNNALNLLKSSMVYNCKNPLNQVQQFLSSTKYTDYAIQALELSYKYQKVLEILEKYIANNFNHYIHRPQFPNLPCHIIYRLITWYIPNFEITNDILELYFKILEIKGTQATPLFLTIDYSKLSPLTITRIIGMSQLDFDSIGPLIMKYVEKTQQDCQAMEDLLSQKRNQVSVLKSEFDRVNTVYESTVQRQRLLTSKLADLESKRDALISELKAQTERAAQLEEQITQRRNETAQINKQRDDINAQKLAVQKETDEVQNDIAILKQQIADREMQQKAALAAREFARRDEEMRKVAERQRQEEMRKQEEMEKQKIIESSSQVEQKSQSQTEKVSDNNYVEPSLTLIEFDAESFKRAFLEKDIKPQICTPPSAEYCLKASGFGRACELEFMWTCVQNMDAIYRSGYGALLLTNDPQSLDLAATLICQAAEKDEPYALYNLGALIVSGLVDGEKEEAADYICRAAMKGEPDAQLIVKELVHWNALK